MRIQRVKRSGLIMIALAILVGSALAAVVRVHPASAATPTPVQEYRVIGYSVGHRPIVAYHLGNRASTTTAVLIGQMHGDERAGVYVAGALVHGSYSVENLNLWVIPTMNPDGNLAHTRGNAHGVDLNRNWPDYWVPLSGEYYSGPNYLSEPETRAVYSFLSSLRPHYVVVLHQPLYGVDTTDGGALDPAFRNRLAGYLHLPLKAFRCWSFCHGSLTGWYTTHRYGIADTIEFGSAPSYAYLTGTARRGIVWAMGGHFGYLSAHNPRASYYYRVAPGGVHIYGWAFDYDLPTAHISVTLGEDGHTIAHGWAAAATPLPASYWHVPGVHGYGWTVTATPGTHTFCITYGNLGAGTGNLVRCASIAIPAPSSG